LKAKGILETRLAYKGYGASHPVAANDTEEGRAMNRRTEMVVISK
jgi:outer membrane protein OmpA-like peptidoglycan-associated protein